MEKSDLIQIWLENGIDIKNRRIAFGILAEKDEEEGSEFNWRTVELAVRGIYLMELDFPNKPIELHMGSGGGDAYYMLRLYDTIQASSCQFKFFGSGLIGSSATWIMAGCDERYLTPNTRVLIHDSALDGLDLKGHLTDNKISLDEEKTLQHKLNQIYADNSRMPIEFWEEFVKRDKWLSAEETIELGLADKIVEPKKRGNLRRMRIAHLKKEIDYKEFNKMLKDISDRNHVGKNTKFEVRVPKEHFDNKVFISKDEPTPIQQSELLEHKDPSTNNSNL